MLESLKPKLSKMPAFYSFAFINSWFGVFFNCLVSLYLFLSALVFMLHYTVWVLFCSLSLLKKTQKNNQKKKGKQKNPNTFYFLIACRSPWNEMA